MSSAQCALPMKVDEEGYSSLRIPTKLSAFSSHASDVALAIAAVSICPVSHHATQPRTVDKTKSATERTTTLRIAHRTAPPARYASRAQPIPSCHLVRRTARVFDVRRPQVSGSVQYTVVLTTVLKFSTSWGVILM